MTPNPVSEVIACASNADSSHRLIPVLKGAAEVIRK